MALGLLAAVGLGPLTTNGSPVDSPLGLALLAVGARPRQFGQAVAEESRSLPVSPTLTSQAIDTVATKESQQTVVGDDSMSGLAAMSTSQTVPEVTSAALMTSAAPVTFTAQTGSSPAGVVASPDGTRVYVANTGSNTVSVFNTATGATDRRQPQCRWNPIDFRGFLAQRVGDQRRRHPAVCGQHRQQHRVGDRHHHQ